MLRKSRAEGVTVRIALCHVRSGQFSKDKLRELQDVMQRNYARQFGKKARLCCIWRMVPSGQGYTKSNTNHVSWLMIEAPEGITMEQRHRALAAFSLAWAECAGVSTADLALTLSDSDYVKAYRELDAHRVRPMRRLSFVVSRLWQMYTSRYREGYFSIST
jgi:hypothetical protein